MSSFNSCITKHALADKLPLADLEATAKEHEADGLDPHQAMIRAVSDKLELALMEEAHIVKTVRTAYEAAGGKKKPVPKPKPEPVVTMPAHARDGSAPAPGEKAEAVAAPTAKPAEKVPEAAPVETKAETKKATEKSAVIRAKTLESQPISTKEFGKRGLGDAKMRGDIFEHGSLLDHIDNLLQVPSKPGVFWDATHGGDVQSPAVKRRINGVRTDAQLLRNLIENKTFREKGFSGLNVETQRSVLATVLRSAQDLQVLDPVIKYIPVDVVDMLAAQQLTPEMVLHDPAMLQSAVAEELGVNVSAGRSTSSTFVRALALSRAIEYSRLAGSDVNGLADEVGPAGGAINDSHAGDNTRGGDISKVSFDNSLYADIKNGTTVNELLDRVVRESPVPENRILAKALREQGLKTKVMIDSAANKLFTVKGVTSGIVAAGYSDIADTAYIYVKGDTERHALHELIHAASIRALYKNGPAAQRIKSLYAEVKSRRGFAGQYGISNPEEFVAEAFTNPRFRQMLADTPAPGAKISLWQKLVGIVRIILGKSAISDNMLQHVMAAGHDLMAENHDAQQADGPERASMGAERRTRTIEVDGVRRPITDSNGILLASDFNGQMEFWKWYKNGPVDAQGHPVVTDGAYVNADGEKRPGAIRASIDASSMGVAETAMPEGLTPAEQGMWRKMQGNVQDGMNRVRQVQDRIEQISGVKIAEASDYYGSETNRPGRIAARLEDGEKGLFDPLMKKLVKAGHTPVQLEELLHAMHASERNEAVARINPENQSGSGMTDEAANTIIERYAGPEFKALHAIANDARAIAHATLDLKLAYGLLTPARHEQLSEGYAFYVPLKGDGEFGPAVKRAMGHDEREEHILPNIVRDYKQAVIAGEKNLARQSLLKMVLQNPDGKLWTVGVPPKGRYVAGKVYSIERNGRVVATLNSQAEVTGFLEAKGREASQYAVVDSAGEQVAEFTKPLQDNEVMVYVKGDPVRLQIHDEQLAAQLRPLNVGQMNMVGRLSANLNRWYSKAYTGYNPAFILRNAARDAGTGTINMMGNYGTTTAAKAWLRYPKALAALGQWATTGKIPEGSAGDMLREYRAHGGKVGASHMGDLEQQGKSLKRMYDDAYGASGYLADGKVGKASWIAARKTIGALAHVVEIANQSTENALRLALYTELRQQGQSPGKAAQAAKTVTVDFDRRGTSTNALSAAYLFFNPAVQGTANAIKTLVKGEHKGQAWAALGGLATLAYWLASKGMDEDKDRWLGEKWSIRSKNFKLTVGSHDITIPVSQEFAPFFALGTAMAEASRGEKASFTSLRLLSSFIDAYVPFHNTYDPDSDNHGADLLMALTPTLGQMPAQIAFNRNSFGSQIVPDSPQTKDRPDNLKMNKGTKNTPYDKVAQGIAAAGEALGAAKYENDLSKVSPETLKLLWANFTGGLGTFIADSTGVTGMALSDPSQIESSDVPFVKDFVKNQTVKPIRSRYYDLTREARAALAELAAATKAEDSDAANAIHDHPVKGELLALGGVIGAINEAAGAKRDEMVDINASTTLNGAEKRKALKALEVEEEELYRDGIQRFKDQVPGH